jgi:hypothetical protein
MIALGRHRGLTRDAWSELTARAVIEEIATDAIAEFHPDTFWPAHPSDDGVGDGNSSFYVGAAGVAPRSCRRRAANHASRSRAENVFRNRQLSAPEASA